MDTSEPHVPEIIRTTRFELYERVWKTPVRELATEFGLSSGGFVGLCGREEIPLPIQGYWNHGLKRRKALRIPLPEPEIDWKIDVRIPPDKAGKRPTWRPPLKGIVVPRRLGNAHSLVEETRVLLQTASRDEFGRVRPVKGCLSVLASPRCQSRALRILDAVVKECVSRGWIVEVPPNWHWGTIVRIAGGEVRFRLEELVRRESRFQPRVLTDDERKAERRSGRLCGGQVYARAICGELALIITAGLPFGRRAWREGERFRLEYLLRGFFKGLEEAGAWEKACAEARAKAEARRREEEQAQEEEEERERERERVRMAEQARVDVLVADAEAWATSRTLRNYIAAKIAKFKAAGTDMSEGSEVGRWVAWAKAQADRLDPLVRR